MRVVEQHIIRKGDPRYNKLDEAAFVSKDLWNAANYLVRQSFIFQDTYLVPIRHRLEILLRVPIGIIFAWPTTHRV